MQALPSAPRKVHIIPVGFEVERVTRPLEYLAAEKVYLIIERKKARNSYMRSIQRLLKSIKKVDVQVKLVDDFWDYDENMEMVSNLLYEEVHINDNRVWLNLSSGSKLHSTIGLVASQMFGFIDDQQRAHAYYVKAKRYRDSKKEAKAFKKFGSAQVPEINNSNSRQFIIYPSILFTPGPEIKQLELLKKLKDSKTLKAKNLRNIFDEDEDPPKTPQAKAAKLIRLAKSLVKNKLIETTGKTRSRRYKITEKGKSYLRSFGKMIELSRQEPRFR